MSVRRVVYFSILALILVAAAMHMVHLRADFPNSTPWGDEVGKITDEGWWANGAVRAHLQGSWNVPGDYSPAPSDPVWPALLWCLFCFTGVSLQAARGLAVAAYFCSLWMTFLLLRKRMPIWAACLALALLVTSPYLYCFTRLALLEPLLTTLTLAGISLALRLPKYRHPVAVSVVVGLICALLMLTKPTAAFLFPAIAAAVLQPLWGQRKLALRCAATVVAWSRTAGTEVTSQKHPRVAGPIR